MFQSLNCLHRDGDNLKIETSSGKYNLSTLPSEDFPVFEKEEGGNTVNITGPNLKALIYKTSFAMGNQDWRHYLNGLYISVEDNNITSVATDAHRLANLCASVATLVILLSSTEIYKPFR